MNLVLTMAGQYSRFKLFGSKVPKYLLPLGTETILAEVIRRFTSEASDLNLFLVANRRDQIFFPIVRSIMSKYNIPLQSLLYINDTTTQLETALSVKPLLSDCDQDRPIAFANIDTVLIGRTNFFDVLRNLAPMSGLLDTFHGTSSQYSFARKDDNGNILDVVDKSVISTFACSGLYGFGSFKLMSEASFRLLQSNSTASFTHLYNYYIDNCYPVPSTHSLDQNKTIVLGTPDEYVINIHRFT